MNVYTASIHTIHLFKSRSQGIPHLLRQGLGGSVSLGILVIDDIEMIPFWILMQKTSGIYQALLDLVEMVGKSFMIECWLNSAILWNLLMDLSTITVACNPYVES